MKTEAMNKYKKQQLLNNLFLYSLTTLACGLFCSSPFWYHPLSSFINVFLFISVPHCLSVLFSSKFVFVIGNLIVFLLVGKSKVFSSKPSSPSEVYYDDYVNQDATSLGYAYVAPDLCKVDAKIELCLEQREVEKEKKLMMEEEEEEEREKEDLVHPVDFNKRADDFIARVNRQRRLEARLCF